MKKACLALVAALAPCGAAALDVLDDALARRAQSLADEASARSAPGLRVQVRLGRLDPRLNLAPCSRIEPHLPPGMRLWGAARIGLRCTDAGVRWNVFLPITVDIFGPALVAGGALPAGTPLTASSVQTAIVNLSEAASPPLTRAEDAVGRVLARPVAAGQPLRDGDLRTRQWFDAGDTVRIVAGGAGWRVHAEGKALNPGIEGRTVRVRTESGRVVSGLAAGERTVEVSL